MNVVGVVGVLIIGASWLGGIAFGLYAWIVWGLLGLLNVIDTDPFVAMDLAMPIVWLLFLAKLISVVIVWFGTFVGGIFFTAGR